METHDNSVPITENIASLSQRTKLNVDAGNNSGFVLKII
jgi:hypothetical protein